MTMDLQIVTPDGKAFGGPAQRVLCRTVGGDICILPRHCNYCTPLGMGEARVTDEAGNVRRAACIGGVLTVMDGNVVMTPDTFEWSDELDLARAERAKTRAEEKLAKGGLSDYEWARVEAKLNRATVRIAVASPEAR